MGGKPRPPLRVMLSLSPPPSCGATREIKFESKT
nr:MAG TPA: hypothetical protein [Caudoviricetes sp.]